MIVSEARIEANRRNARLSTGPRTEAGKERSRRNALTHGLSAEVVRLPEDGPASADPGRDWPGFLAEQVTTIASRLQRCDRLDARHRERIAHRAESFWDDDRRLEAEFLGSGIAKDPAEIARALRRSPQGCDWMAERWALLARAADRDGSWTAEQRSLAFDLLGRPVELRGGDPAEVIDGEGRAVPGLDPAGLARRELAALARRKAEIGPIDALDRDGARSDPDAGDDPELRKLRRHEADLHRRLRWCVAQLAKAERPASSRIEMPPTPPANSGSDDLSDAEMEAMMAQAHALRRGQAPAPAPAPAPSVSQPATRAARPDPRVARDRAREAARRDKREARRA